MDAQIKKADALWGELMHKLYTGCTVAEKVGELGDPCSGPLEAHHIITKGRLATRHDPRNGILLCNHHHQHSRIVSPHTYNPGFWLFLNEHCRRQSDWAHAASLKLMRTPSDFTPAAMWLEDLLAVVRVDGPEKAKEILWQ